MKSYDELEEGKAQGQTRFVFVMAAHLLGVLQCIIILTEAGLQYHKALHTAAGRTVGVTSCKVKAIARQVARDLLNTRNFTHMRC